MSDQVNINGNAYSWGSISATCANQKFTGFTAIKYADGRERSKLYGMGRHQKPRGRTRGKYSTEPVGLTGPKGTIQELRKVLAAQSSDGKTYGDVEFQIVVQYVETGEEPITVVLNRCVFAKNSASEEEGPDPLLEEIELDCMWITRNGLTLFDGSRA